MVGLVEGAVSKGMGRSYSGSSLFISTEVVFTKSGFLLRIAVERR
jgi:hypothetical protein